MNVELVNKTTDNASPPWTTFIFRVNGGNDGAHQVMTALRRVIPSKYLMNTTVRDGQVVLTVVEVVKVQHLLDRQSNLDLRDIAALMQ